MELIKSIQRVCRTEVVTSASVKLATIVSKVMSNSPMKLQGPVVAASGQQTQRMFLLTETALASWSYTSSGTFSTCAFCTILKHNS